MHDARDTTHTSPPIFDPQDFDFSASALEAKAEADIAHLSEQLTLILGSHQEVKGLVRRLEALLADRGRKEAERDAALASRLLTAGELRTAAEGGAWAGAEAANAQASQRIDRVTNLVEAVNRRIAEDGLQRATERGLWVRASIYTAIGAVAAVLVVSGATFVQGARAGEAKGYARARDEVAAASWANTLDGRFARALYGDGVLGLMRTCTGEGWEAKKANRRWACFAGPSSTGWYLHD